MTNTGPKKEKGFFFDETGFGSYHAAPSPPRGHIHDTLEVSVFEGGRVTMLYGGQAVTVPSDRLVVHWGMLPHQMVRRESGAQVVGVHVPLSWLLQWSLPNRLLTRILGLELLIEPPRFRPFSDLALLLDWCALLLQDSPVNREIVLSELRGRLLRMANSNPKLRQEQVMSGQESEVPPAFGRALAIIARRFQEPLRIREIAHEAGISPRHLTRIFAEYTGQTVNRYILRLRISHVQRLLVTTNRTILDIMLDAGFSCTTQFYEAFRSQTGMTPRQYRQKTSG
jgi:AraC-like DNA-binding protein